MKTIIFVAFSLLTFKLEFDQEKEKFKGQALIEICQEPIAVDFGYTDSKVFLDKVQRLDSVELVWLSPMSHKRATYAFCYLVLDADDNYGLVKSADFQDPARPNLLTVPLEMEDYHFYEASCFRQKLAEHPELKKYLRKM